MVKLRYGLRQADAKMRWSYSSQLLDNNGTYGRPLTKLDALAARYIPFGERDRRGFLRFCRLSAVHECEQAKEWLIRQRANDGDYYHKKFQIDQIRARDLQEAIFAIQKLARIDRRQPYFLRQAFADGLAAVAAQSLVLRPRSLIPTTKMVKCK